MRAIRLRLLFGPAVFALLVSAIRTLAAAVLLQSAEVKVAVYEHADQWTGSARASELLSAAGFSVQELPLDQPPSQIGVDAIVLGSFVCEHEGYRRYMDMYRADLGRFVAAGGTLIQFTQADQNEADVPFLPDGLAARRCDADSGLLWLRSPGHPLVQGILAAGSKSVSYHPTRSAWESFDDQNGFHVILSAEEYGGLPTLMEAVHGSGRIVLAAWAVDKAVGVPDNAPKSTGDLSWADQQEAFATRFFANLYDYVRAVRGGTAPVFDVTPPPPHAQPYTPGAWTLAVMPDTQMYSQEYPGLFLAQTGWIAANKDRLDIRYVVQLGDVVNNNTDTRQWQNARDAFGLLDGVVPYAIAPGNHDFGPRGSATTRDTGLNDYFSYETMAAMPTFGGAREAGKLDNVYHLFEAGGRKWIIITLEWAPQDDTLAWAARVMEEHPDRFGILATHAYLNNNDRRYDYTDSEHPQMYNPHLYQTPGTINDGQQIWDKLIRNHRFVLTLNGHVLGDGTGYLESQADDGHTVHQILANFQMKQLGGNGYLRLLEFQPDDTTVRVKTFSCLDNTFLLEPDQQFEIKLDPIR